MKFIKKTPAPLFFIEDTKGLKTWNSYKAAKKRALKQHILENEQFFLCCYCERSITAEEGASHIEHLKPKSLAPEILTFDYNNLSISCEGNHFNEGDDKSKNTCGHGKDNNFDEVLFLNPTTEREISTYFAFNPDSGKIRAAEGKEERADYTIDLLNLNGKNGKLAEARKNARAALLKGLKNIPTEKQKPALLKLLQNEGTEFCTFFRFVFREKPKKNP